MSDRSIARMPATLILVWLVSGAGTVAASILGAALGKAGLFAAALVGGAAASAAAVWLAVRFGWIAPAEHRLAGWGAVAGFVIAAPIAALNLNGPVIPVLATSLAGVGALIGAQIVRTR